MNNLKCHPRKTNQSFDHFFNRNLNDFIGSDFFINQPSINILEGKSSYTIEVAAPGLKRSDFHINLDKELLTIEAKRTNEELAKNEKYTRREFSFSSFKRSFQLPENVQADAIEAKYENGVLFLNLPIEVLTDATRIKTITIN